MCRIVFFLAIITSVVESVSAESLRTGDISVSLLGTYSVSEPWYASSNDESFDIDHEDGFVAKFVWETERDRGLEFYYANNSVSLDVPNTSEVNYKVETYQLGAFKKGVSRGLQEYYGAGFGVTRFAPAFSGGNKEDDLSMSLFGGLELDVAEYLAINLEARLQFVFLDSATQIVCAQGCDIDVESEIWSQVQFNAGFTFTF